MHILMLLLLTGIRALRRASDSAGERLPITVPAITDYPCPTQRACARRTHYTDFRSISRLAHVFNK